ncbi:ankyrin repeat domain-containing protein [Adlercreutzia sp. ZJ154]|uniref:ankyrin repeat domain-containing protein n=1 Tax=Adlercreutzia sp. ZJ154 TaxID=2709790 RepID=UPI0013EDECF4|nr:ankyrin repeat domain-containing protein [Adlercreutzia sp. ZJ154]
MGVFSKLFGKDGNDNSANTQSMHNSITRALAGVVYYDSTMGQFARALRDKESEEKINSVVSSLIQALMKNGSVSGKETIESLVGDKVERLHNSGLKIKDLNPCLISFLVWAVDDAKKLGLDKEIIDLLFYAFSTFADTVTSEEDSTNIIRLATEGSMKYELIASYVDTGTKSPEYDSIINDENNSNPDEDAFSPNPRTSVSSPVLSNADDAGSQKATPLFNAAINHDFLSVHEALVQGANPNIRSLVGYKANPYSIDSEPGIHDKALNIMRRQALDKTRWPQLFYKPELGFTNLYFPAMEGDIVITHLLLEAGADPNARSLNGLFPLYTAAEHGHINVVKELIEHGADVNQTTPKGCTALLNAAEEGQGDVVVYLLKHGADPRIANEFGKTPLQGAEEFGHDSLAALIYNYEVLGEMPRPPFDDDIYSWSRNIIGRDVSEREFLAANSLMLINSLDSAKDTAKDGPKPSIAVAIANGDLEQLSRAIESGCDVNAKYVHAGKRITPIVEAALANRYELVEVLLNAGADPNISQDNGETALMNAAQNGNFSIVSALLEAGADPNAVSYAGTALALADNIAIIFELCQKGADPNIGDRDNDLPIIGFIDQNRYEAVLALMICGTNLDHRNNDGESVVEHAQKHGRSDVRDLVVDGKLRGATSCNARLDQSRAILENRINKLIGLSYPLNYFTSCESQKYQEMITDSQRSRARQARELVDEAVNKKRNGDLEAANALYIEATADDDILVVDTVWGWFKVLLLSKNFEDAYLILRYYHALAASKNHLLKNEGELDFDNTFISSSFLTLEFDAFTAFYQATNTWPMDKEAVEEKISAFGGSNLWANYHLSPDQYDCFIRFFGYPEMYELNGDAEELSEEEKIELAVSAGDPEAHVKLAKMIYKTDRERAIALCERAVELGDPNDDGSFFLAWLISDSDPGKARGLYEKCVENGRHYGAANNLGLLIEKDNPERAIQLYQMAVDAGNTLNAARNLATLIRDRDPEKAKELYRMAIDAGDEYASTFQLAMLIEGEDPNGAVELYKRSIEAGDKRASSARAAELLKGTDPMQAADLFRMSAEAGNVEAYAKLARIVYETDRNKAIEACEQAVHKGDVNDGAFFLAWLLESADVERSKQLYQLCIDNGNAYGAGRNLGHLLKATEPEKAAIAYEKAIESGNKDMRVPLARLIYENDRQKAVDLCEQAVADGDVNHGAFFLAWLLESTDVERSKELYQVCIDNGYAYGAGRNLGNLLRESSPDEALTAYNAALKCDNEEVYFNIGLVQMYKNTDLAIEAYNKAIAAGFTGASSVNLAHIYMLSNPSKAKELYETGAKEGETEALIGLVLLESQDGNNVTQKYLDEIKSRANAKESFEFMIDYFERFDSALAERVKLLSEK